MIPVARPLLPSVEAITPYLREIDRTRIYSNFGPLVRRLEQRLAARSELGSEHVVTVANGTLALAAVLMAAAPPGPCLLPSWTFSASAHAVRLAGFEPVFVDVDPDDWQLTPVIATEALEAVRPSAVLVVAPFGSPVATEPWDEFAARTGLPVIIDAAASFATQAPSRHPTMVSLHATKPLAAGEGAFVVAENPSLISKVRRIINFGFDNDRRAKVVGLNAKLSEYSAAVALSALDEWSCAEADWLRARELYANSFQAAGLPLKAPQVVGASSTMVCEVERPLAALMKGLAEQGVDSRRWWNEGCHREPAFKACAALPLPVTERLGGRCLGLPMFRDISANEVSRVTEALVRLHHLADTA